MEHTTPQKEEFNISWKSLAKIVICLVVIYIFITLKDIILMILLSIMLAAALYPLVKALNKRFSITVSSVIVLILLFFPLIIIFTFIVPSFISEFPKLLSTLTNIIKTSHLVPDQLKSINLTPYQQNVTGYIVNSTQKITSIFATYLTVIFMTLYIMVDFERLKSLGLALAPASKRKKIEKFMDEIIVINGHYIRGNIIISIVCASVITAGLIILGVPNAISLGIFAGILDLLPLIGAVTGAVPAIIIGFAISPLIGILVTLLFIVYQQFENNILSPHIYNRILNLSPAISFVAVLIGGALFGTTGAFLALPLAASVPTIINFISSEMRDST